MGVFSLWINDIKEEIIMSMIKLEALKTKDLSKSLCGLYLKKGEKSKLYDICIKYNIPIRYPNLFIDGTHYYLWGISENGVGLIGTIIMNHLSDSNGTIFNSLNDLENHLKGQ